jgi:hypothetical protein
MTHTLHRRGDLESLNCDYIVFTMSAKKFNEEGSAEKMRRFLKILLDHRPVNFGDMQIISRARRSFMASSQTLRL